MRALFRFDTLIQNQKNEWNFFKHSSDTEYILFSPLLRLLGKYNTQYHWTKCPSLSTSLNNTVTSALLPGGL